MSIITPTVGRVVWYWPDMHDTHTLGIAYNPGCGQPVAATIAYVWSDRMVNISYVDHDGVSWARTSVTLAQDGDIVGRSSGYAQWMPYQKGQAAKTEDLQIKVDVLTGSHPPHGQASQSDNAVEKEIQAKALTAPRVTPSDIEANIAAEHYFTVGAALTAMQHPTDDAFNLLTFCVIKLRNGFTVTGESACASPENFDAELVRKIARQNAVAKIWPLMGYELKQRLSRVRHSCCGLYEGCPRCRPVVAGDGVSGD